MLVHSSASFMSSQAKGSVTAVKHAPQAKVNPVQKSWVAADDASSSSEESGPAPEDKRGSDGNPSCPCMMCRRPRAGPKAISQILMCMYVLSLELQFLRLMCVSRTHQF